MKRRRQHQPKKRWNRPPPPPPPAPKLRAAHTDAELIGQLFGDGTPATGYSLEAHSVRGGRGRAVVVGTIVSPDGERRVRVSLMRVDGSTIRTRPIGNHYSTPNPEPREEMPPRELEGGWRDEGVRT